MSAAQNGPAAAVTKPGKCDHIVFLGRDTYVIKHNWRLDGAPGEVLLVTTGSEYQDCHANKAYTGDRSRTVDRRKSRGNGRRGHWGSARGCRGTSGSTGKRRYMPEAIKFAPWKKECTVQRVTGTQWQESDSEAASKLWEELGREEEPTLIARFGRWAGF